MKTGEEKMDDRGAFDVVCVICGLALRFTSAGYKWDDMDITIPNPNGFELLPIYQHSSGLT